MSVKEIRELDEEVKEVVVEDEEEDGDEGLSEEEFSIGDTKLARGEVVETWNSGSLEDAISKEDLNEDFESEDFEDEDAEKNGSSYESADESGSGDMYGGGDASVGDLYGSTNRDDSVSMYNTGGGNAGESSLYVVGGSGKSGDMMGSTYKVEGPRKKKSSVRRGPKSGLENGVKRTRQSKGVSLY